MKQVGYSNGFTSLIIAVLVLAVIGISGVIYYLTQVQNKESKSPTIQNHQPETPSISVPSVSQEQQKNFQSAQYKFSLTYPANWDYKENDPFVPNLAEYTVTFVSPDQNTGLDVWIRSGNWTDVEKDLLKDKNTAQTTVAGQPAILQSQGKNGKVVFVNHPSLAGKVLVFSSIGENLEVTDQIQQTLKFE